MVRIHYSPPIIIRTVAQLVEHDTFNVGVAGPIPASPTTLNRLIIFSRRIVQMHCAMSFDRAGRLSGLRPHPGIGASDTGVRQQWFRNWSLPIFRMTKCDCPR